MRLDVSLFSIPALAVAIGGLVMGIALILGGAGNVSRLELPRTDPYAWPAVHAPAQAPQSIPATLPPPAA